MIKIDNKYNCCGCAACVQVCPQQCIEFSEDIHGFRYPSVHLETCVDCHLCEKVCPVINQSVPKTPLAVYAAKNINDDVRMSSSSGGIFTSIAEAVIKEGGVVFGARFDENWEVRHSYAHSMNDLSPFKGSKYLQSIIGQSYVDAKQFLDNGRQVLFTGTPCQIAGLKKFLRKDYINLTTVDLVCHGVPSPLVWRSYLDYVRNINVGYEITDISFRSKISGWKKYSILISGRLQDTDSHNKIILQETIDENLYMKIFLHNLCLRPSCFACPSKSGKSYSDITLADFWGIEDIIPDLYDSKGVSMVMVNSDKGLNLFQNLHVLKEQSSYESAIKYNSCIELNVEENKFVSKFWELFSTGDFAVASKALKYFKPSYMDRVISLIKKIIKS